MFQQIPFIPLWKTQPLLITQQEAILALHVLRTFRNLRSLWQPVAKYHELSRPVSHLIQKLVDRVDSMDSGSPYRCSESMKVQLDTDESLLIWKALNEYSLLRRQEVSPNAVSLIKKVQAHLTCPDDI